MVWTRAPSMLRRAARWRAGTTPSPWCSLPVVSAPSKEQWLGTIKFVAIHSRALTKDQVLTNYTAGVGEKYFMLFDVTDLTGVPQSYVQVTASVLDNYAYSFTAPTFISLNPNAA